ncbi:hypothetical protein KI387_015588, partial [Taxus chinensis]
AVNTIFPHRATLGRRRNVVVRCNHGFGISMDRRQLLFASTSSIALGNMVDKASSESIPPPDLERCSKPDLPNDAENVNCCPPFSEKSVDFQFPDRSFPMRVRPSAHNLDKKYVEKYKRAVQLMRELPSDDPRSFKQQANVHCAYCDGAYYQGSLPLDLQNPQLVAFPAVASLVSLFPRTNSRQTRGRRLLRAAILELGRSRRDDSSADLYRPEVSFV